MATGIYAYTPELYPTALRATGMGVASSFGRIVVLVIGALAVGLLGIATAGKSLEQIAAEELGPTGRRGPQDR